MDEYLKRTVFETEFEGHKYHYGLTYEETKERVESSAWYGPASDELPPVLGDSWDYAASGKYWSITSKEYDCPVLKVKVTGQIPYLRHLIWECPFCNREYSDDYSGEDIDKIILKCGCKKSMQSPYFLAKL